MSIKSYRLDYTELHPGQELEEEDYVMVTNLSCPTCESIVYVYYPKEKEDA